MAEILGLDKITEKLRAKVAAARDDERVDAVVGYSAAYALHVHENLEATHKAGRQAKFLEQPMRENGKNYFRIIIEAMRKGRTVGQSILLGALALQRDSQKIVPIDTGALRASAYTRLE